MTRWVWLPCPRCGAYHAVSAARPKEVCPCGGVIVLKGQAVKERTK